MSYIGYALEDALMGRGEGEGGPIKMVHVVDNKSGWYKKRANIKKLGQIQQT